VELYLHSTNTPSWRGVYLKNREIVVVVVVVGAAAAAAAVGNIETSLKLAFLLCCYGESSTFGSKSLSSQLSSSLITGFLSPGTSPFEPMVHPTTQASSFRL
jgi:hypothetical protein